MIQEKQAISMTETHKYIDKETDTGKETYGFIKKFVKMKPEKAEEMRKKLEELDLIKLKQEDIAKIIDLLPENSEELNKICNETGLNEDETNKILDIVKEFK